MAIRSTFALRKVLLFVSGALFALQFSSVPGAVWGLVSLALVALIAWTKKDFVMWFFFGFVWTSGAVLLSLHDRLEPEHEGADIRVEGVVSDLPRVFEQGARFNFRIDSVLGEPTFRLPDIVRLSWYKTGVRIRAGQKWRLLIRLKRPHGTLNPGGFDYERWLFEKGIGAIGYVRRSGGNRMLAAAENRFSPNYWRQYLSDEISRWLDGTQQIGLVKAISIGFRDEIDPHQWEILRDTGTSHLVAISGLHVGLVAAWAYWLTRRFWTIVSVNRWPPPKVAAAASIFGAA